MRLQGRTRALIAWIGIALILMLVVATVQAGERHYYYTDPQGTILAKADATGNVIETSDYQPYGVRALGVAADGAGYTGHVSDVDAGLIYMQARYYDPQAGRFLSVDPIAGGGAVGSELNRYGYANNNPIRFLDPDGKLACGGRGFTECQERVRGLERHGILPLQTEGAENTRHRRGCDTPECDEVKATRANILQQGGEQLKAAGTYAAKEAGWMALSEFGGRGLSRFFGRAVRFFHVGSNAVKIADGHAFSKHIGEFSPLGITTERQLARHIDAVMAEPSAVRSLSRGRTAFWDSETGTVVIRDPVHADGGTAFIPKRGIDYFNGLQ